MNLYQTWKKITDPTIAHKVEGSQLVWSHRHVNLDHNACECRGTLHPLDLLERIVRNPRLTRYPGSLHLGKWDSSYPSIHHVHPQTVVARSSDSELGSKIRRVVRKCSYIPREEVDLWTLEITRGNVDACTALVLSLLPNLRVVELLEGFRIGEYVRSMVHRIVTAVSDRRHRKTLPLRHLTDLRIRRRCCENGDDGLKFLAQLAALPAARTIYCEGYQSRGLPWNWVCPRGSMGVTAITIKHGNMLPKDVFCLLERTVALKEFTYELNQATNPTWFPLVVCDALRHFAKGSLEELHLQWHVIHENEGSGLHLGSLHHFYRLKRLRVRCKTIAYREDDKTEGLQPLVESLPISIEELYLMQTSCAWELEDGEREKAKAVGNLTLEDLAALFDGFAALRKVRLPNLKKIKMDNCYDPLYEDCHAYKKIRMACKEAGVDLQGLKKVKKVRFADDA